MSARVLLPLALGFSRAHRPQTTSNSFHGWLLHSAETVEAVPASISVADTWQKSGTNEGVSRHTTPFHSPQPHHLRATPFLP